MIDDEHLDGRPFRFKLKASCSCSAVNNEGPFGSIVSGGAPGGGAPGGRPSGVHFKSISKFPVSPVRSTHDALRELRQHRRQLSDRHSAANTCSRRRRSFHKAAVPPEPYARRGPTGHREQPRIAAQSTVDTWRPCPELSVASAPA